MQFIRTMLLASATFFAAESASGQSPPAAKVPDCTAAEYRQLDFWLGDWMVIDTASSIVFGSSHIEPAAGRCTIREQYSSPRAPGGAYDGTSYSSFDRADRRWHQFYVDSHGTVNTYVGGSDGSAMVLLSKTPAGKTLRMTYRPMTNGTVRQTGETSINGEDWTPVYDYTYRRP